MSEPKSPFNFDFYREWLEMAGGREGGSTFHLSSLQFAELVTIIEDYRTTLTRIADSEWPPIGWAQYISRGALEL